MSKSKFNFNETSSNVFKKEIDTKKIINQTSNEEEIKIKFDKTIKEIEENFILVELAEEENKNISENLLRGQVVFLFGAVDLYMHDIILESYMKIIYEEKESNKKLDKVTITLQSLINFFKEDNKKIKIKILENSLREFNNYRTYLKSNKIKQSLQTISNNKLYSKILKELNISEENLDDKLDTYYARRNKISHQMDFDIELTCQTSIDKHYVIEMIDFYKKFIDTLHEIIINDI